MAQKLIELYKDIDTEEDDPIEPAIVTLVSQLDGWLEHRAERRRTDKEREVVAV